MEITKIELKSFIIIVIYKALLNLGNGKIEIKLENENWKCRNFKQSNDYWIVGVAEFEAD